MLNTYIVLRVHKYVLGVILGQGTGAKARTQKPCSIIVFKLNSFKLSGGNDEKDTPVLIPNTAVKLLCADNTWMEASWEDK